MKEKVEDDSWEMGAAEGPLEKELVAIVDSLHLHSDEDAVLEMGDGQQDEA